MNVLRIAFIFFALVCLQSCGWLKNKFAFYPDQKSEIDSAELPSYIKKHTFSTQDGKVLESFMFKHTEPSKKKTILYFHGNAGNLYHRFGYCQTLWKMGYNVFIISCRGYAQSTGSPTEKGIYIDGESAYQYLINTIGLKSSDIIILGRSIGSTVAIHTAMEKDIFGVILITPLSSGYDMAKQMVPSVASIAKKSFENHKKINDINGKILIIHGTDDEVTPFYMGQQLYDEFDGEKEFITIKGGRHNDLQDVDSVMFWGAIDKFKL